MKFEATFKGSAAKLADCPSDGIPEIALTGRSNVGKSSLINSLAHKRQLARVSATPGKTQVLNYYSINSEFYLVDMPGYGYAKRSKTERMQWARMIESYLGLRESLKGVGVLIDSRHELMASDGEALSWLRDNRMPFFVVLTKMDQSSQTDISRLSKEISKEFPGIPILSTSSKSGRGITQLQEFIKRMAVLEPIERNG
jgi:GTP-binding protein